jgi:hypothetical protein
MRGLRKQFKAPRQVRKEKDTARQSESDDDAIPFSELRDKVIAETQGSFTEKDRPGQVKDKMIRLLSEIGSLGVFFGTVLSVEYDSDDEIKAKPFYCVQYSDGDREDLNEDEFGYAQELCYQMDLDAEDAKMKGLSRLALTRTSRIVLLQR